MNALYIFVRRLMSIILQLSDDRTCESGFRGGRHYRLERRVCCCSQRLSAICLGLQSVYVSTPTSLSLWTTLRPYRLRTSVKVKSGMHTSDSSLHRNPHTFPLYFSSFDQKHLLWSPATIKTASRSPPPCACQPFPTNSILSHLQCLPDTTMNSQFCHTAWDSGLKGQCYRRREALKPTGTFATAYIFGKCGVCSMKQASNNHLEYGSIV